MTSHQVANCNTERVGVLRIAVVAFLLLAAPAHAQDPGVIIDPGAPSAKEYALPFESERRQADPEQGASAPVVPGARSSPTFGEGITSGNAPTSRGPAARAAREADGNAATGKETTGAARESASDGDAAVVRAATSNPGAPDGGAGVTLTIAGIALGVLLVGGMAGLLWRRRA